MPSIKQLQAQQNACVLRNSSALRGVPETVDLAKPYELRGLVPFSAATPGAIFTLLAKVVHLRALLHSSKSTTVKTDRQVDLSDETRPPERTSVGDQSPEMGMNECPPKVWGRGFSGRTHL